MALWGPSVMMGAAIATRPRFSASAFIDDVRRFGATKFSYVGKAIAYILATPERPDDADNTLKSAFGTEASVRDRDRFRKRFGCYLIEGYGASEGGAAINAVIGMPKGALGKPVDGVDLAVMSPETGEECPPAEFDAEGRLLNAGAAIGEIVNRSGRGSFEGYYERPDAEQERLRHGWYWTGDLGYVDADGFFYFAGRTGDWLRVDSENFAAGPVESIISRHPDLAVAAVYPVPDTASGAGDQVMVAVETVPGTDFDPDAFADLADRAARPGPEVAPPLRPGLALAPPDGHREGHQGGPAGRGLGLRRPGVVAPARQLGRPVRPPHRRRPKDPGRRPGRERPPPGGRLAVARSPGASTTRWPGDLGSSRPPDAPIGRDRPPPPARCPRLSMISSTPVRSADAVVAGLERRRAHARVAPPPARRARPSCRPAAARGRRAPTSRRRRRPPPCRRPAPPPTTS